MITKKIKILDLYCGCGGCSIGYYQGFSRHGYEPVITGVDINPQPNYPYTFVLSDAITYLLKFGRTFDIIHASPPCQFYSTTKNLNKSVHPDLISTVRECLLQVSKPYIIENVVGSPLINPILICGLMVGLDMPRHRLFETSFKVIQPNHPIHKKKCTPMGRKHIDGLYYPSPCGNFPDLELTKRVMGLQNATKKKEVAQAIPPAYTSFLVDLIF